MILQKQVVVAAGFVLAFLYAFNQMLLLQWIKAWHAAQQVSIGATTNRQLVVDFLSIGSQRRLDYLNTQQQLCMSHPMVRHVFNATEVDDVDPFCDTTLTTNELTEIIHFCRSRNTTSKLLSSWRRYFAPQSILQHKANPIGWLCAQARPVMGLYHALQHYQVNGMCYPDYLVIQDDDTFWNLNRVANVLKEKKQERPLALAGCMIRLPNLWIPHGGFGSALNQALLKELKAPLAIAKRSNDDLREWQLGRPNITLMDLMQSFTTSQSFQDHKKRLQRLVRRVFEAKVSRGGGNI